MTTLAAWRPFHFRPFLAVAALLLALAGCGTYEPITLPNWQEEPLPEAVAVPFGQGRIWMAELPGQEPSYLFGTIHLTDPRIFTLPDAAETAFAKARYVAFETAIDDELSEEEARVHIELPEDTDLETVIGAETYAELMRLFIFRVLKFDRFDRMQPWLVTMLVGDQETATDIRHQKDKLLLDDWLQQRALDAGKEVVPLETAQQQLTVFSGMAMADQVSMLRSAIDHYDGPRVKVQEVRLYLDGNLDQSFALWDRFLGHLEPAVAQRFNARLLTDRNRQMTARLAGLFAQGPTFVAVGAMHMPGEEGILRMLEQRGYTVTRLQ